MKQNNIYNSSGKIIGYTCCDTDKIYIHNTTKPYLIIDDVEIVSKFDCKQIDKDTIINLYDNYLLCIGEIASILGIYYSHVNKIIKQFCITSRHAGRRNSSYGKTFSNKRKTNISNALKGNIIYNDGVREYYVKDTSKLPQNAVKGRLPFSNEHKAKIRQAGLDGKYLSPSERSLRGWKNGKFDDVDFGHSIGGYFYSNKMNKKLFFRSLLELYYIIHYLENNPNVLSYKMEPFRITCENGHFYTPDILVNNKIVIELKPRHFIESQPEIKEKFLYKKEQGQKYCKQHNLLYAVIFDDTVGMRKTKFRAKLKNGEFANYKIEFTNPKRVYG